MEKKKILKVKNLYAGYGKKDTIRNISLSLDEGEILCIVGESGCGKSTLMKSIFGIFDGLNVHQGSVELEDVNLCEMPKKQQKKLCCETMGMVFQNPGASFNPIRSYRKQFREALKACGRFDAATFEESAATVFKKLGLGDAKRILDSCPYEMSGGMNQRIAFAMALLSGKKILLADEPTSALDATIQLQVANELRLLRDVSEVSQLVVTHNLALAGFIADKIAVLYAGRLVEYGDAKSVIHSPRHPYTKSLIEAVPHLNSKLPKGLQGCPPEESGEIEGCTFRDRCPYAEKECAAYAYENYSGNETHRVYCLHSRKIQDEQDNKNTADKKAWEEIR